MTTIPLLRFPCLVQQNILRMLKYSELFYLSFCSKRTKSAIKKFRWKNVIGYVLYFTKDHVKIMLEFPNREVMPVMILVKNDDPALYSGLPTFKKKSELEFFVRIQRHTCELFSKTPNLNFIYVTKNCEKYRKLEKVRKARLDIVNVEDLEEFIRNHQELQYLVLDNQVSGEILPSSNINDIKSIWFLEPSLNFDTFLLNFRGENAVFKTPIGFESHIDSMIENWLNGRYSENLKVVYIAHDEYMFPENGLLDKFDFKECDKDELPEKYECDEEMQYHFSLKPEFFNCDEAVFIKREKDGKMISIRYETFYFLLCVWH